jgi:endonuclease/exonuclease/phosphatase family metal-dependent hydrolase
MQVQRSEQVQVQGQEQEQAQAQAQAGDRADQRRAGSVKLITWNIQWCRGCDGRVDPQRIIDHARTLADFDVLCLQEVAANFPGLAGSSGEDQFLELARLLPGYEAVPGVAVDLPDASGRRRRFGNLVLSRLPVNRVLRHQLPWPARASIPGKPGMPRLLLEVSVQSPLGDIRVMTTHLEYYSPVHRAAQVEAIRDVHAQSCAHAAGAVSPAGERNLSGSPFEWAVQPAPAILTGDFNFKPDDPLHQRMQAPLDGAGAPLVDSWTIANPGVPHQDTNGVHDRVQWPSPYPCDFIYVSADLAPRVRRVVVDPDSQASDHQPVLIELS